MKIDKRTLFVRAWQIAKSASFERAGTVASEFFGESLRLAWVEARKPYSKEIEMSEKSLPTLTGSEKQKSYALDLRQQVLEQINDCRKTNEPKVKNYLVQNKLGETLYPCLELAQADVREEKIMEIGDASKVISFCKSLPYIGADAIVLGSGNIHQERIIKKLISLATDEQAANIKAKLNR
jgi:hypothetical protein